MNLKWMDYVPGVGQFKGVCLMVTGDMDGAKQALYQSTRSSCVSLAATFGGPPGALATGALCDLAASNVTGRAVGVFSNIEDIIDDYEDDNVKPEPFIDLALKLQSDIGVNVTGVLKKIFD